MSAEPAITDPEVAVKSPDFLLQGEYEKEGEGLQIATLSPDSFLINKLKGGLPGQGWDAKTVQVSKADAAATKSLVEGYKRVQRQSSTLDQKAPADAIVLFDGKNTDQWDGAKLDGQLL